jgi:hypothetical protein
MLCLAVSLLERYNPRYFRQIRTNEERAWAIHFLAQRHP